MYSNVRMIRMLLAALPTCTNNKNQIMKFLKIADSEFANCQTILRDPEMMKMFVRGLVAKLEGQLFSIVSNCDPQNYWDFRKSLVKSTSSIRPRAVIENETKSCMQAAGETALGYYHRVENLLNEYRIALEKESVSNEQKQLLRAIFEREVLTWLPNGLLPPLNFVAKMQIFRSIDDFKDFLQSEKDNEENVSYVTKRANLTAASAFMMSQPLAGAYQASATWDGAVPQGTQNAHVFPFTSGGEMGRQSDDGKTIRELQERLAYQDEFNATKAHQIKIERMMQKWMEGMTHKLANDMSQRFRRLESNDFNRRSHDSGPRYNQQGNRKFDNDYLWKMNLLSNGETFDEFPNVRASTFTPRRGGGQPFNGGQRNFVNRQHFGAGNSRNNYPTNNQRSDFQRPNNRVNFRLPGENPHNDFFSAPRATGQSNSIPCYPNHFHPKNSATGAPQ